MSDNVMDIEHLAHARITYLSMTHKQRVAMLAMMINYHTGMAREMVEKISEEKRKQLEQSNAAERVLP